MCRRSERTSGAVERAGCEREPQSGRELDERLHGWPFCGDAEVVSERGKPKAGRTSGEHESRAPSQRSRRAKPGIYSEAMERQDAKPTQPKKLLALTALALTLSSTA